MPARSWGNPVVKTNEVTEQGAAVYTRELDFDIEGEPWAVYRMRDGGVLRVRSTVLRVLEVLVADPQRPETGPDGMPQHFIAMRHPNGDRSVRVETIGATVFSN